MLIDTIRNVKKERSPKKVEAHFLVFKKYNYGEEAVSPSFGGYIHTVGIEINMNKYMLHIKITSFSAIICIYSLPCPLSLE